MQVWWIVRAQFRCLRSRSLFLHLAELPNRSERRRQHLDVGPRCAGVADHLRLRADRRLERLGAVGARLIGDIDVFSATTLDRLVASGVRGWLALRLLRGRDDVQSAPVCGVCSTSADLLLVAPRGVVRQQWRPSRVGALLGLICGVQYLISSEILTSMVVFGVIAAALFVLANRRALASRLPYVSRACFFALTVGGALLAGPILFTLSGPGTSTECRTLRRIWRSCTATYSVPSFRVTSSGSSFTVSSVSTNSTRGRCTSGSPSS